MKRMFIVAALALLTPYGLVACGSDGDAEQSTPAASTTSSVAATTTDSTPVPSSSPTPEVVPITFECGELSVYESGTALYSDGTTGYEAVCDTYVPPTTEAPAKVLMYCDYPGTAVYTDGTSSGTDPACATMRAETEARENANTNPNPGGGYPYDPEEDRNGDGVVNGYERCGVRCGKAPTSGDIQTQHGCEEGYIGREICEQYGW